jgi:hypothetical protein
VGGFEKNHWAAGRSRAAGFPGVLGRTGCGFQKGLYFIYVNYILYTLLAFSGGRRRFGLYARGAGVRQGAVPEGLPGKPPVAWWRPQ